MASASYLNGTLIQGLIALVHPNYDAKLWQGTLLFYATAILCMLVNTVASTALPKVEVMVLVLYVLGFFAIVIPLVYLGPHGSAKTSLLHSSTEENGRIREFHSLWDSWGLSSHSLVRIPYDLPNAEANAIRRR